MNNIETIMIVQNIDRHEAIALSRMINKFKSWLFFNARHCVNHGLTEKEAFEEAGLSFSALRDLSPDEIWGKYDDCGISLDLLWAEDLLNDYYLEGCYA